MSKLLKLSAVFALTLCSLASHAELQNKEMINDPYFSDGTIGDEWFQSVGTSFFRPYTTIDGVNRYHWAGGTSPYSAIVLHQNLVKDGGLNADLIENGFVNYDMSFYLSSYSGDNDSVAAFIEFYDANNQLVTYNTTGWTSRNTWGQYSLTGIVPDEAVFSRISFHSQRESGSNNDGFAYAPSLIMSVSDQNALDTYGSLVVNSPSLLSATAFGFLGLAGLAAGRRKKK